MLLGILLGAVLVLLVFVCIELAVALKKWLRKKRKDVYLPDKKKWLLTYIELSRHNNQDRVDRLFRLRRW